MENRFYLERSEELAFRGLTQQVLELMDGILNIDAITA